MVNEENDKPEQSTEATETPAPAEPAPAEPVAAESAETGATEAVAAGTGSSITESLFTGTSTSEEVTEAIREPAVIRGRIDRFGIAMGTGRRKTSVARVRIKAGNGQVSINGRSLEDYFKTDRNREAVEAPLRATDRFGKVDVWVRVNGGGTTGQAGAIMLGIARALQALDPTLHATLSDGGYLTRDGRMVERKKYGYKKARKSFQFSKR